MPDAPLTPENFDGTSPHYLGGPHPPDPLRASGTALDSLAAVYGVERQSRVLTYSFRNGGRVEHVEESDEELRYRLLGLVTRVLERPYDLDVVAEAYGITRDRGESDERLTSRIQDYLRLGTPSLRETLQSFGIPPKAKGQSRWALVGEEDFV